MSTPNTPLPYPPPEPDTDEVPTAAAELQILLFTTDIEGGISSPGGGSPWPADPGDWIAQLILTAVLVASTLLGANLAHIRPTTTTTVVLAELVAVFGIAQFRRISRHK